MAAALTTISWLACVIAILPTLCIAMGIKFQEDREAKHDHVDIVDGQLYLRRYRYLWASIPMAFLLLGLVAVPMFSCGRDAGCDPGHSSTGLFVTSLVVGLIAWSLTLSLLYNRYFHSRAERPFRRLIGAERGLWMLAKLLVPVTIAIAAVGVVGLN